MGPKDPQSWYIEGLGYGAKGPAIMVDRGFRVWGQRTPTHGKRV